MKVIKYVIEIQMIYSIDSRSLIDTINGFSDDIEKALDKLDELGYIYSNNKNVAIEINKYEFNEKSQEYEYLYKVIGFYGIDAANYLGLDSQIRQLRQYGLIIV